MKKFYYFLLASLVLIGAGTATAKIANLKGHHAKVPTPEQAAFLQNNLKSKGATIAFTKAIKSGIELKATDKVVGKRNLKATPLITSPTGEKKIYDRAGNGYYYSNGSIGQQAQTGIINIVFGEDNKVYFQDIINYAQGGTFIEGTIEGDQIIVELPQTIVETANGYNLEVAWVNVTDRIADRDNTQAIFTIDGNTISLEGSDENYVLGGVWDDDDTWYGAGDYNSVYTLKEDLPEAITLPEGLTATPYYYTGKFYDGESQISLNNTVNVAKDGTDIYFQGLMTGDADNVILPEAWVKGTLDGNTVTIPMGQYIGMYGSNMMYVVGRGTSGAGDVTFTYDPDAETFTLDNNMYVNGKPDAIYYYIYHLAGNVISLNEPEPEPVPELVTLPYGVEPETDWVVKGTFNTNQGGEDINKATQVAFDGDDVYIQGLAYYFPEAWIKGTIADGIATFAGGQFVGEDDYGQEYVFGYVDGGLGDITMTYDAENNIFTAQNEIVENDGNESLSMWAYTSSVEVYKGEVVEPEVVVVPDGLETKKYTWTATLIEYSEDQETGESTPVYTEESLFVNIGLDGDDVYVQGLCVDMPEAWVKGTKEGNVVTFPTGQYFGEQAVLWFSYKHFFVGYNFDAEAIEDVVADYDEETDTYTVRNWIIDNEGQNALNPFLIHTDNVWGAFKEVQGKPQNPEISSVNLSGSYPNVRLNIPLTDVNGNTMNPDKVFYRIFSDFDKTISQLEFTPEDYESLEETLTEIPYNYDDDWDIYRGGSIVYLNQAGIADANRIGVQIVNYSGMDVPANPAGRTVLDVDGIENESDIIWFKVKNYTGIDDINANVFATGVRYFNAAGQQSKTPFRGVNIVVKTMSDGSVQVEKLVK